MAGFVETFPLLLLRTEEGVGLASPVHIGCALKDTPPRKASEGVGLPAAQAFQDGLCFTGLPFLASSEGVGLIRLRLTLRAAFGSLSRCARLERIFSSHGRLFDSLRELAEGVGFEPTVSFTPRSISSRVP